MRRLWLGFILAVVGFGALGCKTDEASKRAADTEAASVPANGRPAASDDAMTKDDSSAAPVAVASATKNDGRPVIVCFGDSLTAGYGADAGASYPDYLQGDLDKRGYRYRVVNEGISGNTTKDGVARVDRVIALKPAVVVLEFGGNDGLRGLPIASSRANLDAMLAKLTASGTKVVVAGITLPPDFGPDYINQFDQTYVLLAKKYKVPMIPFLLKGVFGVPGMMQADRTHATAAGNQIVAENVFGLIKPLLTK
jgi:acyl-CoA thioesterase-1